MARFEDAIEFLLDNEGGLCDHPSDPGGITNYGISLRYLKSIGELGDIDKDGDIDGDDVRALTRQEAIDLYRSQFWDRLRLDEVSSQMVATRIFDMAVNMGPVAAVKILQSAANAHLELFDQDYRPPSLVVDGGLGPKTREVVEFLTAREVYMFMHLLQHKHADFYRRLAAQRPQLQVFLNGWLRRAAREVSDEAVA